MIANVPREDSAVATGFMFLFRSTGEVSGATLSGALLQAILTNQLRNRITGPGALEVCLSGLPPHSADSQATEGH